MVSFGRRIQLNIDIIKPVRKESQPREIVEVGGPQQPLLMNGCSPLPSLCPYTETLFHHPQRTVRSFEVFLGTCSQCHTMKIKIFGHMSYKNVLLQGVHETNAVVESQELLGVIISEVSDGLGLV